MTQTAIPSTDLDTRRLDEFIGQFAADLGAVLHCATVLIGDRLGLYRAMADCRLLTAEELAERTGTHLRYVREWLAAQAASGHADYDPSSGRFRLTPEQAFALTSEDNPVFAPGGLQLAASARRRRAHRRGLSEGSGPVGRIFYSASTTICLPVSRSQDIDAGLGGQAGEAKLRGRPSCGRS